MASAMSKHTETASGNDASQLVNGSIKSKTPRVNGKVKHEDHDEASRKRKRRTKEARGVDREGEAVKRKTPRPEKKARLDEDALPPQKEKTETQSGHAETQVNGVTVVNGIHLQHTKPSELSKPQPRVALSEPGNISPTNTPKTATMTATKKKKKAAAPKHLANGVALRLPRGKWSTSQPIGGSFSGKDVAFSQDEAAFFVLQRNGLQVFNKESSLLERIINPIADTNYLTDFAVSVANPTQVYVTGGDGVLNLWDFTTGQSINGWRLPSTLLSLRICGKEEDGQLRDLVFAIDRKETAGTTADAKKTYHYRIKYLELFSDELQSLNVHKSESPLEHLRVLDKGKVLVCSSERWVKTLHVKDADLPVLDWRYNASVLHTTDWISCLDARLVRRSKPDRPAKVDIAIGDVKGPIHLFRDVFRRGKRDEPAKSLLQKLHWHREGVHTVKFAGGGEYLVSGGAETVLVIWQLDTNMQQYIPHLSATIEAITVSPSEASYALRLASNAVVILKTSDQQPEAYVAGFLAPAHHKPRIPKPARVHTRESDAAREAPSFQHRHPFVLHPRDPTNLQLAIPAEQSSSLASHLENAKPYLQQFSLISGRHIRQQVIAQSNITDRNIGGANEKLQPANTTALAVSADGTWLASTDEWSKDPTSGEPKEVYLKFWQWDEGSQDWALNTRIDDPHASVEVGSDPSCQALVAHPSDAEFATSGTDGRVKIWRAQKRLHAGLPMLSAEGHEMTVWICYKVIVTAPILSPNAAPRRHQHDKHTVNGTLTYSPDASILALTPATSLHTLTRRTNTPVNLLDPLTGSTVQSLTDLQTPFILTLAVLDRYLILLSTSILILDLTTLTTVNRYPIPALSHPSDGYHASSSYLRALSTTHLAVSQESALFAVTLPTSPALMRERPQAERDSQIYVFSPHQVSPVFHVSIDGSALGLLSLPVREGDAAGFVVVDHKREARVISSERGILGIVRQGALERFGGKILMALEASAAERTAAAEVTDVEMDEPDAGAPSGGQQSEATEQARRRLPYSQVDILEEYRARQRAQREQPSKPNAIAANNSQPRNADEDKMGDAMDVDDPQAGDVSLPIRSAKREISAQDIGRIFDESQSGVGGYSGLEVGGLFERVLALL